MSAEPSRRELIRGGLAAAGGLLAVTAAPLLSPVAAAAERAGAAAVRAGGAMQTVRVAFPALVPDAVPIWIADGAGYFRAEHLKIAYAPVPAGGEPVGLLGTPAAEFALTGDGLLRWDEACCGATGHADAVFVAAAAPVPVYRVLAAKSLRTAADLRGRTIGVSGGPSSAAAYTLQQVLARHHVSLSEVHVTYGATVDRTIFQQFKGGKLDAAVMPPPMSIRSTEMGYTVIGDSGTLGLPYPSSWLAVDRTYAKVHAAVVKSFVRAYARGIAEMLSNRSVAVAAIANQGGVGQPDVATTTYDLFVAHMLRKPMPPAAGVGAAIAMVKAAYAGQAGALAGKAPGTFIDATFARQA